jgi:hypothetical protein
VFPDKALLSSMQVFLDLIAALRFSKNGDIKNISQVFEATDTCSDGKILQVSYGPISL